VAAEKVDEIVSEVGVTDQAASVSRLIFDLDPKTWLQSAHARRASFE
jgi:hypothetical protein